MPFCMNLEEAKSRAQRHADESSANWIVLIDAAGNHHICPESENPICPAISTAHYLAHATLIETITPDETWLKTFLNARYCSMIHEKFRNLHFSEQAKERLFHIAGAIWGLCAAGKRDVAAKMARDIGQYLQEFDEYGGTEDVEVDGQTFTVRRFQTELHDDGTFGGFGFLRCRYVNPDYAGEVRKVLERRYYNDAGRMTMGRYAPYMNGGLLYHGPGGDETLSVTIGEQRRWWSSHT